jgi:1,2-phenylacetyl-CoA epoxidase catalytic subunit
MKKLRHWLAEKILGAKIGDTETVRQEWIKEQLKHGNTVTLTYEAKTIQQDSDTRH